MDGVNFRAANEAAWAAFLDALGEPWLYEALEPDISRAIRYQPDFWLPKRSTWLEIKSAKPTPGEWRVARELRAATGNEVYIVSGWPRWRKYQVYVVEWGDTLPDGGPSIWGLVGMLGREVTEIERAMEAIRNVKT